VPEDTKNYTRTYHKEPGKYDKPRTNRPENVLRLWWPAIKQDKQQEPITQEKPLKWFFLEISSRKWSRVHWSRNELK